jgi:hypothetical protein
LGSDPGFFTLPMQSPVPHGLDTWADLVPPEQAVALLVDACGLEFEGLIEESVSCMGAAPASMFDHHSGKYGLLFHSLDVAMRLRPYGADLVLAGFLHDIGKCLPPMHVETVFNLCKKIKSPETLWDDATKNCSIGWLDPAAGIFYFRSERKAMAMAAKLAGSSVLLLRKCLQKVCGKPQPKQDPFNPVARPKKKKDEASEKPKLPEAYGLAIPYRKPVVYSDKDHEERGLEWLRVRGVLDKINPTSHGLRGPVGEQDGLSCEAWRMHAISPIVMDLLLTAGFRPVQVESPTETIFWAEVASLCDFVLARLDDFPGLLFREEILRRFLWKSHSNYRRGNGIPAIIQPLLTDAHLGRWSPASLVTYPPVFASRSSVGFLFKPVSDPRAYRRVKSLKVMFFAGSGGHGSLKEVSEGTAETGKGEPGDIDADAAPVETETAETDVETDVETGEQGDQSQESTPDLGD